MNRLITLAGGLMTSWWAYLMIHYANALHGHVKAKLYLTDWYRYSVCEWWYIISVTMFTLTAFLTFWTRNEATKRTDPKMNVLADEPKTAKSVKGDENENESQSERQVLR